MISNASRSENNCARRDIRVIPDSDIMLDNGASIDDRMASDVRAAVYDCAIQNNRALGNAHIACEECALCHDASKRNRRLFVAPDHAGANRLHGKSDANITYCDDDTLTAIIRNEPFILPFLDDSTWRSAHRRHE